MKRKAASSGPTQTIEHLLYRKPGYKIRRLQQMAVSIFLEETEDFDITPVQYATLAAVSVFPGIDQLRVANAIGFDRTTISGVIDRLESKRLLVRQSSGGDRRSKTLFATPDGTRLLSNIEGATSRVQDRILEPLSSSERKLFLDCLGRLIGSHNESTRVPTRMASVPTARVPQSKRVAGQVRQSQRREDRRA